jgi:hypothetical protein
VCDVCSIVSIVLVAMAAAEVAANPLPGVVAVMSLPEALAAGRHLNVIL